VEAPDPREGWLWHPVVWAAGLAGAMVSVAHTKGLTLGQRLTTVAVGAATAGFITPACADRFRLAVNEVAAAGFLIGVIGMFLTAGVVGAAGRARDDPAVLVTWLRVLLRGWAAGAGPPLSPPPPPPQVSVPPPPGPGPTRPDGGAP